MIAQIKRGEKLILSMSKAIFQTMMSHRGQSDQALVETIAQVFKIGMRPIMRRYALIRQRNKGHQAAGIALRRTKIVLQSAKI